MKLTPPVSGMKPEVTSPRCGSPVTGCSILMTSAPQSASTAPAGGHEPPLRDLDDAHPVQRSRHRAPPGLSAPRPYFPPGVALSATTLGRVTALTEREVRSPYLTGSYEPVQTEITADLDVVAGSLPDDLTGCFVRNSSNPRFEPKGRYHWFDGDGMLHGVQLGGGRRPTATATSPRTAWPTTSPPARR